MPKHHKPAAAKARHVQVELTLPMSLADAVTTALWDLKVLGVVQEDDETRARPYDPTIPKTGQATVRGTFAHRKGLEADVLAHLGRTLTAARKAGQDPQLVWSDVEDKDWNTEWKKHWTPQHISEGLWIVPTWEKKTFKKPRGAQVIWMDPGMAFGTGNHETTQLCTQAMEAVCKVRKPRSLLDVGTGSGVLAFAAVKVAARRKHRFTRVLGIDIDEPSVRVASENARLNKVTMECATTPVQKVKGTFDVVVANILLEPLLGMKEELKRLLAPRGVMVLSGILEKQRPALEAGMSQVGLVVSSRAQLGEWASVTLKHG
jgi:ribosomal protein L11 methyltransferase